MFIDNRTLVPEPIYGRLNITVLSELRSSIFSLVL